MIALLAIIKLTLKSVIRSHIFQILLTLLVFMIIVLPLTLVGDGTAEAQIQISLQYCLGAVSFILSLSTIWLSCFTMSSDIENYQIHMVITKPVSYRLIWVGKALGILVIHTVLLIFSALLVYILVLCQFQDQMFLTYLEWPLGIIMALSALVMFIVFCIWANSFFIKVFKLQAVKTELTKISSSNMLMKVGLSSFAVLIIAFATFTGMRWQFNKEAFSLLEKAKIRSKVLVGRRVYLPTTPNIKQMVQSKYDTLIKNLPKNQRILSTTKQNEIRSEISRTLLSQTGEVKAGGAIYWQYKGLPPSLKEPLFLRFRTYIGKISTNDQRETTAMWGAKFIIPVEKKSQALKSDRQVKTVFDSLSPYPEKIMAGIFNEKVISSRTTSRIISSKGEVTLGFTNFDQQKKTLFFQLNDGPKLLVKITGFMDNYCRGIFIIFLKLIFLTGLSCAVGGIISPSVAIFNVISYLLLGFFSMFLIGTEDKLLNMGETLPPAPIIDQIGNLLSHVLMFFIIPMQDFEISGLLSNGELIEWSMIGNVIFYNVLLKGIPIFLLGVWLYKRRELGLVIKK